MSDGGGHTKDVPSIVSTFWRRTIFELLTLELDPNGQKRPKTCFSLTKNFQNIATKRFMRSVHALMPIFVEIRKEEVAKPVRVIHDKK